MQATTVAHVELEQRLARWFGFESCLLFTTGYQAMVGTIQALADRDTALILDNLSHACILDGTFLAAGTPAQAPEVRYFNHNSVQSLERCLKTKERKNALVLMEGIYSLDGDRAPLHGVRRGVRALRRRAAVRRRARHRHARHARHGPGRGHRHAGPRADRDQHVLEDVRRHRRDPARQRPTWSTSSSTPRARSASARRCRCRSWRRPSAILDILEAEGPALVAGAAREVRVHAQEA